MAPHQADGRREIVQLLVTAGEKLDDVEPLRADSLYEGHVGDIGLDPGVPAVSPEELAGEHQPEHHVADIVLLARGGGQKCAKPSRFCEGVGAKGRAEIAQQLFDGADAFTAGAPQHDDMTVVIARVL